MRYASRAVIAKTSRTGVAHPERVMRDRAVRP
jgi:hypothetical protein